MSIPLIILAFIGLLIYAFAAGKLSTVGLVIFGCALLGMCLGAAPHVMRLSS